MSNGLSFAAHALVLFLVFSVPPDAKSLSLDLFNTDNKFVKILIKPPEQKEDEIPDWLKKKGPDEQGGKGQKHKGEEGKMGSKKSKKKTGLYGLKGPKDNTDPHLAKRLAEDAAKNAGVLGLLKSASGSHIASIFGRDTALGTDAEDALGGLIGNQIGEAYGVGGLGLVGTGRGGGGTGEGTIGLGHPGHHRQGRRRRQRRGLRPRRRAACAAAARGPRGSWPAARRCAARWTRRSSAASFAATSTRSSTATRRSCRPTPTCTAASSSSSPSRRRGRSWSPRCRPPR